MSTPKYEFERYYAEESVNHYDKPIWRVVGEDKPGNLQFTGYEYTSPSTGKKNATMMADALNERHATGFDAEKMRFTSMTKQIRWLAERERLWKMNNAEMNSTNTTILKGRESNPAEQNNEPGHVDQNESKAIEESYPGWATFGSSSKTENDQPEANWSIDPNARYTLNMDKDGVITSMTTKKRST